MSKKRRLRSPEDIAAQQAAEAKGKLNYIGDRCKRCGSSVRTVDQGRCIECPRLKAKPVKKLEETPAEKLDRLRTEWLAKSWRAA
jgi:hypothetical protein